MYQLSFFEGDSGNGNIFKDLICCWWWLCKHVTGGKGKSLNEV